MKTLSKCTLLALLIALATPALAEHKAEHKKGNRMLEKCDTDKDGKVSEMEFLESKKENFKKADKNSDGFLDSTEIKEMMKEKHDKMKKGKKHPRSEKQE